MAKHSDFLDYEYSDEELRQRKQQKPASKPVAKNPGASNQYNNLINKAGKNLDSDVKPCYKNTRSPQSRPTQNNTFDKRRQPSHNRTVSNASDGKIKKNIASSKTKKKHGFLKTVRNVLIVILALYIALTGYLYSVVSHITYNKDDKSFYVSSASLKSDMTVENILFIGVDSRGEEHSRSDTMILISIDKKNKRLKMTSFLRDTYVSIPEKGDMKLNAACFYGGPQLVVDTIESNFGIKIDHYALVDFEAFKEIINALGGVDVDITSAEAKYLRDTVKIPYIVEGHNHLNGGATLWYCRIRYLDSDFNRTERQRKVISSIIKAATKQNPVKLIGEVKKILPYIESDMSPLKLTFLFEATAAFYMHYEIVGQQIPYKGEYEDRLINEQLVLYIDKEKTAEKIKEFIYE